MAEIKHNPPAMWRAMAKGLEECSADSSAPLLAKFFRQLAGVSMEISDEADDTDAAKIDNTMDPLLMRDLEVARKVLEDMYIHSAVLQGVAKHFLQKVMRWELTKARSSGRN